MPLICPVKAVKNNGKSDSGNTDHRISQRNCRPDFASLMDELLWRWAIFIFKLYNWESTNAPIKIYDLSMKGLQSTELEDVGTLEPEILRCISKLVTWNLQVCPSPCQKCIPHRQWAEHYLNFCNILAWWIRILRSFLFSLWNSTLETFEHRVPSSNLVSLDLNAKNRTCHVALKQQCHFQPDFLTLSTFWANTIYASLCEIFLGAKAGATLLLAAWTKRIQQETWQLVGWAQTWLIDLLFTAASFFWGNFSIKFFNYLLSLYPIFQESTTGFSHGPEAATCRAREGARLGGLCKSMPSYQ